MLQRDTHPSVKPSEKRNTFSGVWKLLCHSSQWAQMLKTQVPHPVVSQYS